MSKTIFITGASSGLGKITAKMFAENNWTVIATMRNPEKETELSQFPNVHLLPLDVNNSAQISKAAEEAEHISPVDVLLNNAGYGIIGDLEAISEEQLEKQIKTNFLGPMLVTKAFLPYFKKRKNGVIIAIGSITSYAPMPFIASYSATKAAMEVWTTAMSFELEKLGISIKTIVPGSMQTSFLSNANIAIGEDYQDDFKHYTDRLKSNANSIADKPEDIAEIIYKAATDGEKKLHYFAGREATQKDEELKKEGLEVVLNNIKNKFCK